jgi:hypothetical protein
MKFADLTDDQKFEMFQAYRNGTLKTKEDIDKFFESKEPSLVSKFIEHSSLGKGIKLKEQAEQYLLDKFLPEKKQAELTPEEVKNLEYAKAHPSNRPWERADKYLAERVNEKPVDLLENPRFIAHPELAQGLNSLASLANVISPTQSLARFAGMNQGGRLSDIAPDIAKVLHFDPSVRDVVSLAGDLAIPTGIGALGKAARKAAASHPTITPIPEYTGPKPPAAPEMMARPAPPFAPPEVQEYADIIRRNDPLTAQNQASKALLETLGELKQKGLSNAETAAKVVNSFDLPISQEAAETFIQNFPDHPEVQNLKAAMERTATGEARVM